MLSNLLLKCLLALLLALITNTKTAESSQLQTNERFSKVRYLVAKNINLPQQDPFQWDPTTAPIKTKKKTKLKKSKKGRKHRRRKNKSNILEVTTASSLPILMNSSKLDDLIQKLNENPEANLEGFVTGKGQGSLKLHLDLGKNSTRRKNRCSKNHGGCSHYCHKKGKRRCSCYEGFYLDKDGRTCLDIDECLVNQGGCAHACKNTLGSFQCECPPGFRLSDDFKGCVDINECLLNNGHGLCQGTCKNTIGSFECSCDRAGTKLGQDGRSCIDLDECKNNSAQCSHSCINVMGRSFCTCPEGLELSSDWKTCKDINECQDPIIASSCKACINTEGSYTCI